METLTENAIVEGAITPLLQVQSSVADVAEKVKQDIIRQLEGMPEAEEVTVSYMVLGVNAF